MGTAVHRPLPQRHPAQVSVYNVGIDILNNQGLAIRNTQGLALLSPQT
jgi:hypothetical protein